MERREELLRAAARVYAKYGYRGATTRQIADEAGVNEVTIFRQFGTKNALIHEAIASCGGASAIPELPLVPKDPTTELTAWGERMMQRMRTMQGMMRRCMSEQTEHPHLGESAHIGPVRASSILRSYLCRLREHGFVEGDFDVKAAAAMYMGALFSDALGRDVMPDMFPNAAAAAGELYTRLLLSAIGVQGRPSLS